MFVLQVVVLLFATTSSAAASQDADEGWFINPPDHVEEGEEGMASNPVWQTGEEQTIEWSSTHDNYTVQIYQQRLDMDEVVIEGPILVVGSEQGTFHYKWKVQLYDFDLDYSNAFLLQLVMGQSPVGVEGAQPYAASRRFNITDGRPSESESSLIGVMRTTTSSEVPHTSGILEPIISSIQGPIVGSVSSGGVSPSSIPPIRSSGKTPGGAPPTHVSTPATASHSSTTIKTERSGGASETRKTSSGGGADSGGDEDDDDDDDDNSEDGNTLSTAALAGTIAGAFIGGMLVLGALFFWRRLILEKRRSGSKRQRQRRSKHWGVDDGDVALGGSPGGWSSIAAGVDKPNQAMFVNTSPHLTPTGTNDSSSPSELATKATWLPSGLQWDKHQEDWSELQCRCRAELPGSPGSLKPWTDPRQMGRYYELSG